MDAKNIEKHIQHAKKDIEKEVCDRLPRKVGTIAVNHFKQNFRDGGWLDGGRHPWKRTKRQDAGTSDARYGPLTSRRNHLMRSIQARPSPGMVSIENPVPYAAMHNDGGDIQTTVTKKMRKYAWRMAYSLAGVKGKGRKLPKELPREAEKWKGLALTRKKRLTVHIPQRRFMGDSQELRMKINKTINESLDKIKSKLTNGTPSS